MDDIKEIDFEGWLSREPGLGCLKFVYAATGDSSPEVIKRVAHLFKLDQTDVNLTLKDRDQYRLVDLLFDKKPVFVAKGSHRFFEGKMKANLVYTEQDFEVIDGESKEILTIPFIYERYTGLLFGQMMAEITPKLRINFIKKVVKELQCGRISPNQKKISVGKLSLSSHILEHYRDENVAGAFAKRAGIESAVKNFSDSLKKEIFRCPITFMSKSGQDMSIGKLFRFNVRF